MHLLLLFIAVHLVHWVHYPSFIRTFSLGLFGFICMRTMCWYRYCFAFGACVACVAAYTMCYEYEHPYA